MITVIGSVNMDLVVNLPEIPKPGETTNGGVFMQNPGGKGANQAVAAAKMGSHVQFIGCVGDDGFGQELRRLMGENGVDTACLETVPGFASGIALIEVDHEGRNSIAVASGANFAITEAQIDRHLDTIEKTDVAVFQLEIPMDVNLYAIKAAKKAGCVTLLNPAPAAEMPPEMIDNADILTPNEFELGRITGMPSTTEAEIEAAARALQARGVKIVLVTLGSRGVLYLEGDTCRIIPANRVKAVDTTAAGDAFLGGFAHMYEKTRDVAQSIDFGQKVAAYAVQHPGAQQSMPTMAQLQA